METANNKVLSVGLCCLDIVMVCKSYPKEDSDQRWEIKSVDTKRWRYLYSVSQLEVYF